MGVMLLKALTIASRFSLVSSAVLVLSLIGEEAVGFVGAAGVVAFCMAAASPVPAGSEYGMESVSSTLFCSFISYRRKLS